jgi:hypothetical protein
LELRDKLKMLRDRERTVVAGLMLLFGHKDLRDYVRIVWEKHASLLVRSFVEQEINPDFSDVTGLENIRLHPPGQDGDPIAIFIRPGGTQSIWDHERAQRERYPRLVVNNISELPNDLQFRHAVPAVFPYREFAAAGGLLTYGSDIANSYRLAGIYTGRILKGDKPAELPVQQAAKVELSINQKTAKTLGITVPNTLIGRADEVFE